MVPISNGVIIEALRNNLIFLIHKNTISEIVIIISLNISKDSKKMPNTVKTIWLKEIELFIQRINNKLIKKRMIDKIIFIKAKLSKNLYFCLLSKYLFHHKINSLELFN